MRSNLLLENKIAFITGAGSGIGRASALMFAEQGAKIICGDINLPNAQETVKMIEERGGAASAVKIDISDSREVDTVIKSLPNYFGTLDIAMFCAGFSSMKTLDETTDELWDKILKVNLTGTFYCLRAIHSVLKEKGGVVINVASTAAFSGGLGQTPAYAASKGGVCALTRHCARDWGKDHIRVNTLMPSPVNTNFGRNMCKTDNIKVDEEKQKQMDAQIQKIGASTPIGRFAEAEDIAKGALYLASDLSGFMTGITLELSGGRYIYGN